jgi:hypothetical protein
MMHHQYHRLQLVTLQDLPGAAAVADAPAPSATPAAAAAPAHLVLLNLQVL